MDIRELVEIGNSNGLSAPWIEQPYLPQFSEEMVQKLYFIAYLNISALAMIYLWYFSIIIYKEIYISVIFLSTFFLGYIFLQHHSPK